MVPRPPQDQLQIAYSSDLIIRSGTNLAALCVFYDKVILPYTDQESSRSIGWLDSDEGTTFTELYTGRELESGIDPIMEDIRDQVNMWDNVHQMLFQEHVLERLLPQTIAHRRVEYGLENEWLLDESADLALTPVSRLDAMTENAMLDSFGIPAAYQLAPDGVLRRCFHRDLLYHLLRTDIWLPQLYASRSAQPTREALKYAQAKILFSYLLPALPELSAEDLLELRREVADTREGFSMHLQTLSRDVESMMKEGDDLRDIQKYAKSVVDTQMMPVFSEFERKSRGSRQNRLGIAGSKILQVDVPPWTLKFYAQLLSALGLTYFDYSARMSELTNESQAMHFMRTVRRAGQRHFR